MAGLPSERNDRFKPPARFFFFLFPGTRQSPSLIEPAFLMRTSASVALSWNQCLLNHTVEPLKSLTVGSAQLSDQTGLATLHKSKVVAGRENGNVEEGAQRTYCIR